MRIADATIEDLKKERAQQEDGTLDKFKATALREIEIYARIRNVQTFLKNFLGAIMMHVLHIKGPQQGGSSFISKNQDEVAFVKFIEDLCRFSFASPNNYPLLLVIKTCLHKSFLSQPKLFDVVIKGVQIFVDRVRESSLQLSMSFGQAPDAGEAENDRSVVLNSQIEWLTYVSERIASKAPGAVAAPPKKAQGKAVPVEDKENTGALNTSVASRAQDEEVKIEEEMESDHEHPEPMTREEKAKKRASHKPTKHVEDLNPSKIFGKRPSEADDPPASAAKRSSSRSAGKKVEAAKKQKKVK